MSLKDKTTIRETLRFHELWWSPLPYCLLCVWLPRRLQYVKIKQAPVPSTDALCVRRRTMRGHAKTAPSTVASVQHLPPFRRRLSQPDLNRAKTGSVTVRTMDKMFAIMRPFLLGPHTTVAISVDSAHQNNWQWLTYTPSRSVNNDLIARTSEATVQIMVQVFVKIHTRSGDGSIVLSTVVFVQTAETKGATVLIMVKTFAKNRITNGDWNIVQSIVDIAMVKQVLLFILLMC